MKIGLIGAGNMANAIAFGVKRAAVTPASEIYISDKEESILSSYKEAGMNAKWDNQYVADHSDILIFAIKPQFYAEVVTNLNITKKDTVFVSIAPGISIKNMKSFLGFDAKVVRVMPNTPARVLEGMTVLSYENPCSKEDFESVEKIFKAVGRTQLISENRMNEVISLTSSSPAYIYYMIDLMAKKATEYGFDYEDAVKMAAQAVMGSAKMVLADKQSPETLKKNVCSKGGTTIAALEKLEDGRFAKSLSEAMDACTKRAYELGK